MGYGGHVLDAINRIRDNRAMQKSGKKFRGDKKDLYFKYPDNGKSTFVEKELTEAEWAALRQRIRRESIKRRLLDGMIFLLTLVGIFMIVRWLM